MNGRRKLLCVLLLALFLFCYTSTNAFAVDSSGAASDISGGVSHVENSGNSSNTALSSDEKPAKPTQGNVSSPSSQSPSSKASSASTSSRRRRRAVSSTVSSMPDSMASSDFYVSSESSSDAISLPEAGSVSENDPLASVSNGVSSKQMTRIGILAWVCIGLGVLVVLIVILSNRRPPRGPGRSRYHRPKRGGGKHLLSDKYYRGLNRF